MDVTSTGFILGTLAAAVGAVAYLVFYRKTPKKGRHFDGLEPPSQQAHVDASADIERLLGKRPTTAVSAGKASRKPSSVAATTKDSGAMLARQLFEEAKRLESAGAGWPEILSSLNPQNDRAIADHLIAIRGPHMFAPATALTVIQVGCEAALKSDKDARAIAAIIAARKSMEQVTRYDHNDG